MKKLLIFLIIISLVFLAFLIVDYVNVKNKNKPLFIIKTETYDDGSIRYSGMGYHVYYVRVAGIESGYHFRIWCTEDIEKVKERIIRKTVDEVLEDNLP